MISGKFLLKSVQKTSIRKYSVLVSDSFRFLKPRDDHEDKSLDPFMISTVRGFLPRKNPILNLPHKYRTLDEILNRMSWNQPDGSPGLLAKSQLKNAVESLPQYQVNDVSDKMLAIALYRDYSFLTSAYLFEECHHNYLQTGKYGLARDILPKNISVPFYQLAKILGLKPFMEYNTCYALNNYYLIDPKGDITINNVDIFRSFINSKSEKGFIKVHVTINKYSGELVRAGMDVLRHCELKDRANFNKSLKSMRDVLLFMNNEFERMYNESDPNDYNIFRTFIMGIKNQPMFPNGVVFEGCFNNEPQYFRGESGANDSIIPFCDNILGITKYLPHNTLTEILRDFRSYRPIEHRNFLEFTEQASNKVGVLDFARQDAHSLLNLIEVADQNRAFRTRHWNLTNMYIINRSKHPVATGGSPITTWLSNQLLTVIDFIKDNCALINGFEEANLKFKLDSIFQRCAVEEDVIRNNTNKMRLKFQQ